MSAILGNIDPWIAKTVCHALTFSEKNQQDDDGSNSYIDNVDNARKPKLVQVLRVKFPLNSDSAPPYFVVSDGKHSVAVFLSHKLYPPLPNNKTNTRIATNSAKKEDTFLSSMPPFYRNITKGSFITIRKWYVTTTVECAGTRLSQVIMNQEYVGSICLGIVDHVEEKGCSGIDIIGEPENVNLDTDVQRAVEAIGNHLSLTKQLQYCEKQILSRSVIMESTHDNDKAAQSGEQSKENFVSPKPKMHPSFGTMSSSKMHTILTKLIKIAEEQQKTSKKTTTMNESSTEIGFQSQGKEPQTQQKIGSVAQEMNRDEEGTLQDDWKNSQPSSQTSGEMTKHTMSKQSTPRLRENSSHNKNDKDSLVSQNKKKTMTEIEDYFSESEEDSEANNSREETFEIGTKKNNSSFLDNINDLLLPCTQDENPKSQPDDDESQFITTNFLSTQPPPEIMTWERRNVGPATSSQSTENRNNTTTTIDNTEELNITPTKNSRQIANSLEEHDEEKSECMSPSLLKSPGSKVEDISWAVSERKSDNLPTINEPTTIEDSLISNKFRRVRQGRKRRTDLSQLALASKSELPLRDVKKQILLKKLLENGAWFSR